MCDIGNPVRHASPPHPYKFNAHAKSTQTMAAGAPIDDSPKLVAKHALIIGFAAVEWSNVLLYPKKANSASPLGKAIGNSSREAFQFGGQLE